MDIKTKIYQELETPDFPNLEFLFSQPVLELAPEILEELLEQEKSDFQEKLQIPNTEICFEIFDDFSILDYFFSLLSHYQGVHNDDHIRKIIEDFEPKYIDFGNEVAYNTRLYEMYMYCSENCKLSQEQKRILEKTLKAYKIRGITLSEEKQKRLKDISQKLSKLSQQFSNNVLDDRKQFEYIITDGALIREMPEDEKNIVRHKADTKNIEGFLFDASGSSYITIMKYCSDPEIRKHFYETRISFATSGKYDNRSIVLDILHLRDEKAKILGYHNFAELKLEFKMAQSPKQVKDLFGEIAQKAQPKAQQEQQEVQKYFSLPEMHAWDSAYYSRKYREEKYAFDESELKKYFVFEQVLSGMFQTVKKLYNIEMKPILANVYNEDVVVYEVYKDDVFLSYFFTDFFYNPLKRQGAWADMLRENHADYKKIVVNVCNFQKNTSGKTLLTLDEVETMYHEFGHATHEMLSFSKHSELSGFHVEHDFVELPSQLLENWARDEQGMRLFARHFQTDAEIPKDMFQKLKHLETFGNGNFVLKQNEYAMLDMHLHSEEIPKNLQELQTISDEIYSQNSLFPLSENYMTYASFSHIFDGGYAAGYYSYIWAEIIEKEVWKVFKDSGDVFSPDIATKLYKTILGAGTTKPASQLFRDFAGRDPQIDAFLKEKGLI